MERTNSGAFLLVVYLLLAAYLFPLYTNGGSTNELTDWATTVSLVEENSFNIAGLEKTTGSTFKSVVKDEAGGVYSTKAPGLALISAPIYALTRLIIGEPQSGNIRTSWYVLRLAISSIPLLILGIWLYNREVDSYSLAVLLFATPIFPYSLLFYSHVFVAILVYMAFRMIYDARRVSAETCFSAAFLLGVAILCEYAAIVPTVVFSVGLLATNRIDRIRRMVFFLAGLLPPVVLLLLYLYFVFGSPLVFLEHTAIAYPSLNSIYDFLLSPSRGLIAFSPILFFALLALPGSGDGGTRRLVVKIAAVVVTFLAVCGAGGDSLDEAVGPRRMILIMPLLLDSFFDGEIEEYPSVFRGLVFTVSFLFCTLPLLTHVFAPYGLQFPHNSYWLPLMINEGIFGNTLANTFGYTVSYWTILPAASLLFFALFFVWRDAKSRVPFAIGMFVGAGIASLYFFAVDLEPAAAAKFVEEAIRVVGR